MKGASMSRKSALSSGIWSTVLQVARIASQAIVFFYFSRILTIYEIGVYSAAYAFLQIAQLFVRSGVLEVAVSDQYATDTFYSAARIASLIFGVFSTLSVVLIAVIIDAYGGKGDIAWCLLCLSVIPIVDSLGIVAEASLRRRLEFRKIAIRTTVALAFSSVLGITGGELGYGITSLVIFSLASSIVSTAFALWIAPLPRLQRVRARDVVDILRAALNVSLSGFATGSIVPFSQIMLGVYSGAEAVGAYAIAQRVIALVNALTVEPMRMIALPLFARIRYDSADLRGAFLDAVGIVALVVSPIFLGVFSVAPLLLLVLVGQNGVHSTTTLQVLCFHFVALLISMFSAQLLFVMGRSGRVLAFTLAQSSAGVVAATIAAPFGSVAVALAYVARAYLLTPLVLRQAFVHGGVTPWQFISAIAPPVAAAAAMAAGVIYLGEHRIFSDAGPLLELVVQICSGVGLYLMASFVFCRRQLAMFTKRVIKLNV